MDEENITKDQLQDVRKQIECLENNIKYIKILCQKQIYGCVYGQDGIYNCKLKYSQCDKCLAKKILYTIQ